VTAATNAKGTLDRAVGSLSRSFAQRIDRRSAISRLGKYGVALSLGASGAALLDDTAWAAAQLRCCQGCVGGCCGCESRWCDANGNCPSGTCRCGAWQVGNCVNSDGHITGKLMYGDCCGGCNCGSNCNCSSNYDCSNSGCSSCPSCCHQFNWVSDPNRACGDCTTCGCPWYIKCRRAFCA